MGHAVYLLGLGEWYLAIGFDLFHSQLPSVPVSSGSSPRVPSRPPSQPNPHQHQQPQQRVVLMQSSNGQLIALPAGSHFPKQGNAQIVQQQVFFIDFVILVSST